MTWHEFEEITLAQIEALEKRRSVAIRLERFNTGMIVSVIVNANRMEESEPLSPYDFLVGFERDPREIEKEKQRKRLKRDIGVLFARMVDKSPEEIQTAKRSLIARLTKVGVEDVEELIHEVYPDL